MSKMQINPKDILARLKGGETRKEIVADLGLKGKDAKALFEHPLLKGKRTEQALSFTFVEDEVVEEKFEEVVQEVATEEVVVLNETNTTEIAKIEEVEAENTEVKHDSFWSK